MTPFPETEIMTIKRIEVALRKMDFKLLKDGAYKLHEKFHSGFKFEYCDVLKDILEEVKAENQIPEEIKSILIPTIEDILNESNSGFETNRVSALTSLSYNSSENSKSENQSSGQNNSQTLTLPKEAKLNAFSAFGSKEGQISSNAPIHQNSQLQAQQFQSQTIAQNPILNKQPQNPYGAPFHEFSPVEQPQQFGQIQMPQAPEAPEVQIVQENKEENIETVNENVSENSIENNIENNIENSAEPQTEPQTKTIAIFYNQNSSNDKIKNIKKYRELLKKDETELNLYEILNLIKEISIQSNTNVSELKSILEQLNLKEHFVNLITNCASSNLPQLLDMNEIKYSLINPKDDARFNILPLFGLSNLFKCHNCKEEILNNSSVLKSMILECPKCKSPMFPSFFAQEEGVLELDIDCYNQSMLAFSNSKIWLIINPSLEDKTIQNLLKVSLKMSSSVEEIFIIDKDINVRENYKNMFYSIKDDININTQITVIEDFFKVIN